MAGDLGSREFRLTLRERSRLSPDEILTGQRLAVQEKLHLVESWHVGAEFVDGSGRSYDAMGRPKAYQHFNRNVFLGAIADHLLKSNDFTVIDLTGATVTQSSIIRDYVAGLDPGMRSKIIFVGE